MDKKVVDKIIMGILGFLGKVAAKDVTAIQVQPVKSEPVPVAPPAPAAPAIDWSNPSAKITPRFSVKEALLLPSWGVMHVPTEEEKNAIHAIALGVGKAADILEAALGRKVIISVHAWMRPEKANCPGSQWDGKDYNRYIYETQVWKGLTSAQIAEKKVPKSPHRTGHAIDFHIVGFEGKEGCAKIREMIGPHLEALNLRMEDISGGWVHLDDMPVVNKRFFKP